MDSGKLLARTSELALEFLRSLPAGRGHCRGDLRAELGGDLPERGEDPCKPIERLARQADPGLVAMAGSRYFGFVIGGHVPAALAADWLTSTWDQNAGLCTTSPANSVVEEIAAEWLLKALDLPRSASVGFTTGCAVANLTGLAAGRHAVLARLGWNVEALDLYGTPEIDVVIGEEAHATILAALRRRRRVRSCLLVRFRSRQWRETCGGRGHPGIDPGGGNGGGGPSACAPS